MPATIRIATPDDAPGVAAVYAPAVTHAATSFEFEPPDAAEMARRITATLEYHPWLVCDRAGEVLGWVRATRFRERAAYQWTAEVSAYVGADTRRAGVARALYTSLFALLVQQGFFMAYAGVTLPNPASVALHEKMGFTPVGVYHAAGHKFDAWHDVGWWQRALQPLATRPDRPRPFPTIATTAACQLALAAGAPLLRLS